MPERTVGMLCEKQKRRTLSDCELLWTIDIIGLKQARAKAAQGDVKCSIDWGGISGFFFGSGRTGGAGPHAFPRNSKNFFCLVI